MSFELVDAVLPVSEEIRSALCDEWRRLASAGPWSTGEERVAVASEARAARAGVEGDAELDSATAGSRRRCHASRVRSRRRGWTTSAPACRASPPTSKRWGAARLSAVDGYVRGLGAAEEPLPEPVPGEPQREANPAARQRRAFLPTAGGDSPPRMLSAVSAEARAQTQLHGALYLTEEEMGDLTRGGALSRPQTEFVACRVSYLNDCVF